MDKFKFVVNAGKPLRRIGYVVILGWITGSLVCTGLNVNVWPFPSLNVFSDLPKDRSGQWIIRIITENRKFELDPGNVLPMEFFVARSFVGDVVKSKNEAKLNALLDYINTHLIEYRFGFDERWEKTKIDPSRVTHIQIVLKISKIKRENSYEMVPLAEYIFGEKLYAR